MSTPVKCRLRRNMVEKKVKEHVRQNKDRLMRKISKELNVTSTSLQTIVKNDLKLKPYKKQKSSRLAEAQKAVNAQKCRPLLAWQACDNIIFSDE
jgi:hypothetical protein